MNLRLAIVWLAFVIVARNGVTQELKSDYGVKNYSIEMGVASRLVHRTTIKFLELVDEQLTEIDEIRQKYRKLADEIRTSTSLTDRDKITKLGELAGPLNEELRSVLLPDQKELLTQLYIYHSVLESSLAYAMVDGLIAQEIGLSNNDRRAIRQAVRDVFKEYEQAQESFQERAIARLIDAVPIDKKDRFKELLEPMMLKGGMLVPNNNFHFNVEHLWGETAERQVSPAEGDE